MIRRTINCPQFEGLAMTSEHCILRVSMENKTVFVVNPSTGVAVYSRLKDIYCERNSPFTGAMEPAMIALDRHNFVMEDGWRILNPSMMYDCSFTQEEVE